MNWHDQLVTLLGSNLNSIILTDREELCSKLQDSVRANINLSKLKPGAWLSHT